MSYNIYTTEGIVLKSFEFGEADKFFRIFTKEFGLIETIAKGIRKIESKNRYGLQDFSLSDISLIKGREVWRVTNVNAKKNFFNIFKTDKNKLNFLSDIFFITQRFINGEEKNVEFFYFLKEFLNFIQKEDLETKEYKNLKLIFYIKILNNLGYFDEKIKDKKFTKFLNKKIGKSLLSEISPLFKEVEREIKKSIEETHL